MDRITKTILGFAALGSIWYAARTFDVKDMHHRFNSIFHNGSISERATDDKKTLPQQTNLLEKIVKKEERYVSGSTSSYAGLNATGEAVENYTIERGPKPKNYYANKLDDILKGFDSNYPDFQKLGTVFEEMSQDLDYWEINKGDGVITGKTGVQNEKFKFYFVTSNDRVTGIQIIIEDSYTLENGYRIQMGYSEYSENDPILSIGVQKNDSRRGNNLSRSSTLLFNEIYFLYIRENGQVLNHYNYNYGQSSQEPAQFNIHGFALFVQTIVQRIKIPIVIYPTPIK